jgi:hypothetical protein
MIECDDGCEHLLSSGCTRRRFLNAASAKLYASVIDQIQITPLTNVIHQ